MSAAALFVLSSLAAVLLCWPRPRRRWMEARDRMQAPGPLPRRGPQTADAGVDDAALLLELLAAALDAGLSVPRSLELVAGVCRPRLRDGLRVVVAGLAMGASWQHSWHRVRHHPDLAALYLALSFTALTGAPSSSLLFAQADQLRRDARRAAEQRAGILAVKLVVPLGLCSLPAFICLGVVPVVVAMLSQL